MSILNGGWVGVDLDGTLAYHETGANVESIGEPIPKMVKVVKDLLDAGTQVRIFTARVCSEDKRHVDYQANMIKAWCKKHLGATLPVTCKKDYNMLYCYDDRAYHVIPNTGIIISP